jgi:sterol desaturase/sphingolipid hydroxylase (fatty acid hydroxylase superfamily)
MIHPIVFPATYVAFALLESLFPAKPLPRVPRWHLKGIAFFAVGGVLNATLPPLWQHAAASLRVFDLSQLGTLGGAAVAYFALDFVMYWWHRARHRIPILWRIFHQLHHSAERLDISGSVYSHPLDMLSVALITSFGGSILGATPEAAALGGYVGFVLSSFVHLNVKTPRWLGFIIERPESHSVHHERGVHAYNYASLPVIDMLFGTFKNPRERAAQAGFWDGASARLGRMLLGRDVSAVDAE